MIVLVEVNLEVEWIKRALFKAVIDYRHATHCGLCKSKFAEGDPVSVVRAEGLINLIICDACADLVQERLDVQEQESDGDNV